MGEYEKCDIKEKHNNENEINNEGIETYPSSMVRRILEPCPTNICHVRSCQTTLNTDVQGEWHRRLIGLTEVAEHEQVK